MAWAGGWRGKDEVWVRVGERVGFDIIRFALGGVGGEDWLVVEMRGELEGGAQGWFCMDVRGVWAVKELASESEVVGLSDGLVPEGS